MNHAAARHSHLKELRSTAMVNLQLPNIRLASGERVCQVRENLLTHQESMSPGRTLIGHETS